VGDRRAPIYVTELGWGTGGGRNPNQRNFRASRKGQAAAPEVEHPDA